MSEFIDLSHTIEENMPVYPGTPSVEIKKFAQIEKEGFREYFLNLSTHSGTHVEVEAHVIQDGRTMNDYGLDHFYGSAIAIDCSKYKLIETELLHECLKYIDLPDFLLFATGWDKYWGNEDYYKQYPVLSTEAARYLSELPLKGLGIDSVSFDAFNNNKLSNHKILLKEGLILIENLQRLNRIVGRNIVFTCFPLKLRNSDSSPVRACAIIQN